MGKIEEIKKQIIGHDYFFETPFGKRILTYADYTASGRTVEFIENHLLNIQKSYANTHTEDDETGKYMTTLLHKAEESIKKLLNADEQYYLIPTGTGATGAIAKLNEILGLSLAATTKQRLADSKDIYFSNHPENRDIIEAFLQHIEATKPVVFIGPYEHHSNELIWRENHVEVVTIQLTADGTLDLEDLELKVSDEKYKNRYKIGSFSAASNITGVKTPTYEVAKILHKHQAIACFDFAASAPYVEINMNKDKHSYYDAIFLSPHKFLGGPGSSGLLLIKKELYNHQLSPTVSGGGTVQYVSSHGYDFIKDVEEREKAGTPGILQIIKAALAFQLKDYIGIKNIEDIERDYVKRTIDGLSLHEDIVILGPKNPDKRIGIFSFLIKHKDKYLHPRLGTRLLNDLFGIQSRAGCSCAGPYGHNLLGIDKYMSEKYRAMISEGYHSLKPGWIRLNFHYTMDEIELDYIWQAIEFIADYGYLFIEDYELDLRSGLWTHKNSSSTEKIENFHIQDMIQLKDKNPMNKPLRNRVECYKRYMDEAMRIVESKKTSFREKYIHIPNEKAEDLRWFYFSIAKVK